MIARVTPPATQILVAAALWLAPSLSLASELPAGAFPDSAEIERVSELLDIPAQKVIHIYPALVLHRDAIKAEVAARKKADRLTWPEFLRVRTHAKDAARAIGPHLSKRRTYRLMRNVHSFLVPMSIRPRRPLGVLFEPARVDRRHAAKAPSHRYPTVNELMSAAYHDTHVPVMPMGTD